MGWLLGDGQVVWLKLLFPGTSLPWSHPQRHELRKVSHQLGPNVTFPVCSCSSLLPFLFLTSCRDSAGFSSPNSVIIPFPAQDRLPGRMLSLSIFTFPCCLLELLSHTQKKSPLKEGRYCMQDSRDREEL